MLGVNNECLSFTPALRNLALAEGDREHHANVAEVARDIFVLKCDRNAEARHNMQTEARAIVKESQRKITKAQRLSLTSIGSMGAGYASALTAGIAFPILLPFIAVSSTVVCGSTWIACALIDDKEEKKKVFVYSNFPEAVRCDFIKKEAYKILEEEEKELIELKNLALNDKYHYHDENGDKSFYRDEFKKDFDILENKISLAKLARINALHVVIKRTIYA